MFNFLPWSKITIQSCPMHPIFSLCRSQPNSTSYFRAVKFVISPLNIQINSRQFLFAYYCRPRQTFLIQKPSQRSVMTAKCLLDILWHLPACLIKMQNYLFVGINYKMNSFINDLEKAPDNWSSAEWLCPCQSRVELCPWFSKSEMSPSMG